MSARRRAATKPFCLAAGLALAGCGASNSVNHPAGSAGSGGSGQTGSGGASGGGGGANNLSGCQMFPADNPWNQDISGLALNAASATYISNMNPTRTLHGDWGDYAQGGDYYGIPFSTGTGAAPVVMNFNQSADESDLDPCPGGGGMFCYPIPLTAPIEGGPGADTGDDRHVLYVDTAGGPSNCTLYELYNAQNPTGGGWTAGNGAIFHLGSDALRPDGWTSGDAAGLPILPGLVGYDETINKKIITHAMRFTVSKTQQGYIHPATHAAGNSSASLPPMGLRLRLKASFDTSGFSGPSLVILTAMKKYGLILADNGSDWYITGESNDGWDSYIDDINTAFKKVTGSDFEAVDTGPISTNGL